MFYLKLKLTDDRFIKQRLIGDDIEELSFTAICDQCGNEMELSESQFFEMAEHPKKKNKTYISNLYDVVVFCSPECTEKHNEISEG